MNQTLSGICKIPKNLSFQHFKRNNFFQMLVDCGILTSVQFHDQPQSWRGIPSNLLRLKMQKIIKQIWNSEIHKKHYTSLMPSFYTAVLHLRTWYLIWNGDITDMSIKWWSTARWLNKWYNIYPWEIPREGNTSWNIINNLLVSCAIFFSDYIITDDAWCDKANLINVYTQ